MYTLLERRSGSCMVGGGGTSRAAKPRQEISSCLKWLCFLLNTAVFLVGVTVLALGVYLCVLEPRAVTEWIDFIFNPGILLIIIGAATCFVSMIGSLGALRDNVFLLKMFAMCIFLCYLLLVCGTFLLFILFYSDTTGLVLYSEGLSAHSLLLLAVRKYHTNKNLAEFVDTIQEQLECCGVSSVAQGYRDWNESAQFNCTLSNILPEKCGVPASCCRRSVVSEAAGSSNPLLPAMRSLQCWQNALSKRAQDIELDIHTRGCLAPLRSVFESHAVHMGAVVALLIIPVCLSVCLTNILAKQIDHQRFLLLREARREARRKKKERAERARFRDPFASLEGGEAAKGDSSPPKPPSHPPPPLPPQERQERKKSRTVSASPTRKVSTQQPPTGSAAAAAAVPHLPPPQRVKEKRRSSAAPGGRSGASDERVKQWVLQQSDLLKP